MNKILTHFTYIIFICVNIIFSGCYSFKGASIPPNVNTFFVVQFENQSNEAPSTLAQEFSEQLKDKIRNNTRLRYTEVNPHITFSGAITDFRVTAESPQAGELVGFNRLNISYSVEYTDSLDEKNNWRNSFSFFANFGANENLLDVQNRLIKTIHDQILEDIFNKAFSNW